MKKLKIAIATYQDVGRYVSEVPNEDEMIQKLFSDKGHEPHFIVWDDPKANWAGFDCILIKSTWDYFVDKIELFYNWLNKIESLGIPVLNSPEKIKWNSNKHYLKEMEKGGIIIVPTEILIKGSKIEGIDYFKLFDCNEIVIKPCVSGGAMNTIRVNRETLPENITTINEWLSKEDYLIQPLQKEILDEGEWSFVFFNGKFSHHLLKSAKKGEFRIQHFFGGKISVPKCPNHLLAQAQKIANQYAKNCLYARVDGTAHLDTFRLMELEIIEPYLFFYTHPESLENYYQAFLELMTIKN